MAQLHYLNFFSTSVAPSPQATSKLSYQLQKNLTPSYSDTLYKSSKFLNSSILVGPGKADSGSEFPLNSIEEKSEIPLWLKHTFIVIYIALFCVGLVGNTIVIYFVLVYKRVRTMTNKFLANLALADLLVICVCIPVTVSSFFSDQWLFGAIMCKITSFLQGTSLSVSVLTLTAISIDRYYIIYKPMKARSICTNRRICFVIASIWLLSLFIMSPLVFVFEYQENIIPINYSGLNYVIHMRKCFEKWPSLSYKLIYEIVLLLVLFFVPTVFMAYANRKIAQTLWFSEEMKQECIENKMTPLMPRNNNSSQESYQEKIREKGVKDSLYDISVFDAETDSKNTYNNSDRELDLSIEENISRKLSIKQSFKQKCTFDDNSSNAVAVKSLIQQLNMYGGVKNKNRNKLAIKKLLESRKRVVKLVIVLIITFFFSWLPYHCVSLMIDIILHWEHARSLDDYYSSGSTSQTASTYVYPITLCLALANSTTNPICYILFSQGFGKMFTDSFNKFKSLFFIKK